MEKIAVIGGGLGGLTAGALLAKRGFHVTLLEQHNIVGGCATVFKRKGGFTCEVGLHEMDGVYTTPFVKSVFEELNVYGNVEFVKPDEFFKIYGKEGEFTMPDGLDEAKEALHKKFPKEKRAIESYFKVVEDVAECYNRLADLKWYHYLLFPFFFASLLKYKNRTVMEVLDSITNNDELKLILNGNVQYYDDTPQNLSFLLHCVAQHSYFIGGGWFIKGGSSQLSRYLERVIEENGGEIVTRATVTGLTRNSVTYTLKREQKTMEANRVVSNISPADTYRLYNMPVATEKTVAGSMSTVYIGFSKNLKEVYGKRPYSNFFMEEVSSCKDLETTVEKDILERDFVFVDYSQVDSRLTDESKSFGSACFTDELENWEGLDNEAYKAKKEQLIDVTLNRLEKHYSGIKDLVEYKEAATPKTMVRYVKTPNGTAYGYKPTSKQFFRIPEVKSKKVDNLYFTGQFVISGGFSPAVISGKMCCDAIAKVVE